MARPSITLPDNLADPAFCEDENDFHKLFLGIAQAECDEPEDMPYFLFGVRLLLHEYLALVLSKKLTPYQFSDEVKEAEKEGYKEFINHINENVTKMGIPTKEENGKIVFDYEGIEKKRRELEGLF